MAIIKQMDEILANKIAAGEVVEKCASVVKELVENSIDAASTEIKVELKEAGTKEIRIIDNGMGMDKTDAIMAFNRHATSKISNEDDLYNINTLGFRGEALASIASVSNITLNTSQGEIGTIVLVKGGKLLSVEPGEARKGTVITVKDLFYNTPARLKYLKSLYTELANITEYMNRISLSHPNIRFSLTNNDSVILKTDGSNNLLKTIKDIYGIEVAKKMIEVKSNDSEYSIKGYISLPELHRSNRNHMVTIVNGRVVKNQELNKVINESYHNYKPDNRYPITVLLIEVDPSLIDVNIHPTKMDIKFSKMDELIKLVTNTIEGALGKKTLIPKVEKSIEPKYESMSFDLERENSSITPNTFSNDDYITGVVLEANDDYTTNANLKPIEDYKNNVSLETDENVVNNTDPKKKLPELYPVGLVHGTYIICQNDLGMYIIDEHAAKERINYEKYKKKLGNPDGNITSMLFPLTIELANNEFIIIKENFELLRKMGFDIAEFGINSLIVKAHPSWLPLGYENEAIKRIIEVIMVEEKNFNLERFNDRIAASISCKMSIKANTNITKEEMESIINDLRKCENPFNCPHGRPTIIFYSLNELVKEFKRSGF